MGIRRWKLPECDGEQIRRLCREAELPPLLAAVLCARGYTGKEDAIAFLRQDGGLFDPFLLQDMDKAVARIRAALRDGERIAVWGDYDCDGITATALLVGYLQSVGADVIYYLPDREREGYGMNNGGIDFLREQGASLIVTVDNGVSAHGEVAYAASLGIGVVVTDHHTPRDTLPGAAAVVNPHRGDCGSPFKELAGVGVAFKLVCALEEDGGDELLEYYGELVALGTVGDLVPLTGENRVLVFRGLGQLRETQSPGISALLQVSALEGRRLTGEAVAFGLVPRINAAGRMGCADNAVELLLTDDVSYALEIAQELSALNERRKKVEADIFGDIERMVEARPQILRERVLLLSGEGWHHGVIGIVASKVLERFGKPCILFSLEGGEARGSGRSLEGFSIIRAIDACSAYLTRYGGHTLAAGLTLPADRLDDFTRELQNYTLRHSPVMPVPLCAVDCVLSPQHLKPELFRSMERLEPFGSDNAPPLFLVRGARIQGVYPTSDKKHLRLKLAAGKESFYAVCFRMEEARLPYGAGDTVDLVASVSAGEYAGKEQLSVKVRDIRLSGADQEAVFAGMERYARFQGGDFAPGDETLIPCREEFAALYGYLRRRGGAYPFGTEELFFRLQGVLEDYCRMRIALDILQERGLIRCEDEVGAGVIRLLPDAGKADLEASPIMTALRAEKLVNNVV